MMLLGLSLVAAFSSQGEYLKAIAMTIVGLMLSTVGTDLTAGIQRFTFGRMDLIDGVSFLLLAMSTFALAEAIIMVLRAYNESITPIPRYQDLEKLDKREIGEIITVSADLSSLGFWLALCRVLAPRSLHFLPTVWSVT